jgi:signal transduction histidine kinase
MDDKCSVMIKDNGIGMDENELTRIFEPFFTQKEHGNGLGLTLTQNIVLNHKGNITVESKPNYGTIFTLFFNPS